MPLDAGLPLRLGDRGAAVRDVQRRLAAAGHDTSEDEPGDFGDSTEAATRAFQERRGLRVDGICGRQTWSALVEAGYRLGDRLLYHRTPPLRGDDVVELQRRLDALGFDVGRVDGIFGKQTAIALDDFQRNTGLTVDGVCGPATRAALNRLGAGAPERVTAARLREREALRRAPRTLEGRRILVAEGGGLGAVAEAVGRALRCAGAEVFVEHNPDGSEQAERANAADAHVALELVLGSEGEACTTAFFGRDGFESEGGRALAEMIQQEVPPAIGGRDGGARAMTLPVLRETRMPTVVCELAPAAAVVERSDDLAATLTRVLERWSAVPWE